MAEVLRFFRSYEIWIYIILGVIALWQIRKFGMAWGEVRGAAFGMEREAAQNHLNQAALMLIVLLMMAFAEFTLVYFIAPSIPGAIPIPSPTLNLLATATAVIPMETLGGETAATPLPSLEGNQVTVQGCVSGQVMITSPKDGETISGVVKIMGTANIDNFGFYKYEIARPGETIWLSLNAGEAPVNGGELGEWITDVLPPGDYMLRLVVTDNVGQALAPCVVQVRVVEAQE
jgi:hypothetical protein